VLHAGHDDLRRGVFKISIQDHRAAAAPAVGRSGAGTDGPAIHGRPHCLEKARDHADGDQAALSANWKPGAKEVAPLSIFKEEQPFAFEQAMRVLN
jgi:hypothetical protein